MPNTLQSRIICRIVAFAGSSTDTPAQMEFIVNYHCTGNLAGPVDGQLVITTDATQTESQIKNDMQSQIATLVNAMITPTQGYVAADVRGPNL